MEQLRNIVVSCGNGSPFYGDRRCIELLGKVKGSQWIFLKPIKNRFAFCMNYKIINNLDYRKGRLINRLNAENAS